MNDIFLSAPFASLVMAHSDERPALLCVTSCLSGCLQSQITFWHSGLLSQTPRSLRLRASGGSNDKASLTISRQEQGGERGKLNCQREKRREEECRRKGWGGEGALTQSCKMESVIISSFGVHQTLPSLSNTTPLTFLSLSLNLSHSSSCFHLSYFHSSQHSLFLLQCIQWLYMGYGDMIVHFQIKHAVAINSIILINCSE